MSEKAVARVHWSFWLISGLALIWNLLGSANIILQMVAGDLAAMPDWWRAVVESRPIWSTAAMMVAVFGGVIGCILLLFRKSTAIYWFVASLAGVVVTMSHAMGVDGAGPRQIFEAVVMPVVVGLFLIWYARFAQQRSWTN